MAHSDAPSSAFPGSAPPVGVESNLIIHDYHFLLMKPEFRPLVSDQASGKCRTIQHYGTGLLDHGDKMVCWKRAESMTEADEPFSDPSSIPFPAP